MTFFNATEPILRSKQSALDIQDLEGLWRIHFKIGYFTILSAHYTRIDQVFVVWGLITGAIFVTAQFLPISWSTQAILWSALTIMGTCCTIALTWFWAKVERLCWVVYCWVILMLAGLAITDCSIFFGWGQVLIRLCPLWLGLSAVGYFLTGMGMRSRTFLLKAVFHLLAIAALPYFSPWQFLATGIVMGGSLLLLAEIQWDMRPPINTAVLTPEQKQFNCEQHRLRQLTLQENL